MIEMPIIPANVKAEQAILACIFYNPRNIAKVVDVLRPTHFHMSSHSTIYKAMLTLHEHERSCTLPNVAHELARHNELEQFGGQVQLQLEEIADNIALLGNIEDYAEQVRKAATFRKLYDLSASIADAALHQDENALEMAEQAIYDIALDVDTKSVMSLADVMPGYLKMLEDRVHNFRNNIANGVPSGFTKLDEMLGGLQPSNLYVLAARPSIGKCLTAQTLIDDPVTGERLTIEECIRRKQSTVFNLSEKGRVQTTAISNWIDSGMKPCYRVRTKLGRTVETTGHHPFLTVKGWTPLHDLSVGSHIAIPTSVPAFGTDESWSLDMVRLLAYFIAEGGLTDSCPEFTNTDPVIIEDFKQIIALHFPELAIRQEKITYHVS